MPEGSPNCSPTSSKSVPSQQLFFQIILLNMKNKPDVDWVIVAEKAGYNSGSTARVRFNQIMNKLCGEGGRNPLKTSSSTGHSGNMNSQTRTAKTSFPSRITKSKPVDRKNRMVNAERASETSAELKEGLKGAITAMISGLK